MKFDTPKEMKLLIASNDQTSISLLANTLSSIFKNINVESNGKNAFHQIISQNIDVLIVDLGLPNDSGFSIIESIRTKEQKERSTPLSIIVFSDIRECNEMIEIVRFSLVDYMLKPLSIERIKQMLNHLENHIMNYFHHQYQIDEDTFYNPLTKSLQKDDEIFPLTNLEASLLEVLLRNRGILLPKTILIEQIYTQDTNDAAFRNLLLRLRKKVGKKHLVSYRDLGVKFQ